MTDISPSYRRLSKYLTGTRKTLTQACRDLDIDIEDVDDSYLGKVVQQCSHCDIWGRQHINDRDDNPVCALCLRLVGE